MDTRPVIVRTDASANDFWSRVRDSSDVSPEFRVKGHVLSQRNTPFGIQVDPFDMRRPVDCLPPSMRSSRSVERIVLQKAIGDAEKENTNKTDEDSADIIRKLHTDNAILRANLKRALCINYALTRNMLTDNAS
jgi:hypothetical protein